MAVAVIAALCTFFNLDYRMCWLTLYRKQKGPSACPVNLQNDAGTTNTSTNADREKVKLIDVNRSHVTWL